MKIYSWNVNGMRAVLRKGALQKFVEEYQPDVLCLQEIKAKPEQVEIPEGYSMVMNPAMRPGYSGTAILFSSTLDLNIQDIVCHSSGEDNCSNGFLGNAENMRIEGAGLVYFCASEDSLAVREGRVVVSDMGNFFLVNVYVPNSKPDLSRLKLRENEWDPGFLNFLKELEGTKPIVVCGDFNAAHEEIDLARPKQNRHNAGFTDEEREGITNLINAGLVDTFRILNPDARRYTWWSHWGHARENNVGWRIDYFFISKVLKKNLKSAEIYEGVTGSDHCPISIDLEF